MMLSGGAEVDWVVGQLNEAIMTKGNNSSKLCTGNYNNAWKIKQKRG